MEKIIHSGHFGHHWFCCTLVALIQSQLILWKIVIKLGLRQFLELAVQIGVVILILVQSWTNSWLSILTLPLFIAGITRNGERVWALKHSISAQTIIATSSDIRNTVPLEPTYFRPLMGSFSGLPLLVKAYQLFDRLKPHLETWFCRPLSIHLPSSVTNYYSPEDVFKIAELELGFMYDVLYTKEPINYSRISFCRRILCFLCLVSALSGFSVLFRNADVHLVDVTILISSKYDKNVDIVITYVLLIGSTILEIYAIMLLLHSDWAILYMVHQNRGRLMKRLLQIVAPQNPRARKRWSHCMEQLNLLSYCLYEEPSKFGSLISRIPKVKGRDEEFKKFRLMKCVQIHKDLKKLILQQMKEVRRQRGWRPFTKSGEWALERCNSLEEFKWSIQTDIGTEANKQTKFGRAITLWHIATDVCYYSDFGRQQSMDSQIMATSKVLSDYMMYLLSTRPYMLSVATGNILFQEACAKVKAFLVTKPERDQARICRILPKEKFHDENGKGNPIVTAAKWKVLPEVQELASKLLEKTDRWTIISSVWVEMLFYAASNCPWSLHAEQLRRGGELITHVWLLLGHKTDRFNNVLV